MKKRLLQLFIVPAIILGIGSCSDKGGGGAGTGEGVSAHRADKGRLGIRRAQDRQG